MIENIELTDLSSAQASGVDGVKESIFAAKDLSLYGHVETSAEIVLAELNISLEELFALKKGSVIATSQLIDSPFTLILNGKPIALGRLVVDGDYFGFEVTDIKAV